MRDAGLLNEAQDERFGTILWQPAHITNGLPGMTSYFPWAFLQLPAPDGVNVRGAIAVRSSRKSWMTTRLCRAP